MKPVGRCRPLLGIKPGIGRPVPEFRSQLAARYGDPMPADHAETPVVLSRIYTRTGDAGTTALGDGTRVAKTDLRLAAYADVDEANCAIGVAVTMGGLPDGLRELLIRIQNELFDVGADLCNPVTPEPAYPPLRVAPAYITALEEAFTGHFTDHHAFLLGKMLTRVDQIDADIAELEIGRAHV